MSYKTRKFLCALVLLVGLPAYIAAALYTISLFERPSIWLELVIYVGLGMLWAFPLKKLFLGIGKPDPARAEAPPPKTPQAD